MVRKSARRAPRRKPPAAAIPKLSILSALPLSWQLGLAGGAVALLLAIGAGLYLKGHADGDAGGYARAEAYYQKLLADQAAANHKAIEESTQQALVSADRQAKAEAAHDAALAQLEAASGGEGATSCGLDQRRVNDLNTIR